jgi:hypothetical protein
MPVVLGWEAEGSRIPILSRLLRLCLLLPTMNTNVSIGALAFLRLWNEFGGANKKLGGVHANSCSCIDHRRESYAGDRLHLDCPRPPQVRRPTEERSPGKETSFVKRFICRDKVVSWLEVQRGMLPRNDRQQVTRGLGAGRLH